MHSQVVPGRIEQWFWENHLWGTLACNDLLPVLDRGEQRCAWLHLSIQGQGRPPIPNLWVPFLLLDDDRQFPGPPDGMVC